MSSAEVGILSREIRGEFWPHMEFGCLDSSPYTACGFFHNAGIIYARFYVCKDFLCTYCSFRHRKTPFVGRSVRFAAHAFQTQSTDLYALRLLEKPSEVQFT